MKHITPVAVVAAAAILLSAAPIAQAQGTSGGGSSATVSRVDTPAPSDQWADSAAVALANYPAKQDALRAVANGTDGIDFDRPASDGSYWQGLWEEAEEAYSNPDDGLNPGPRDSRKWVREKLVPWLENQGRSQEARLARTKVTANPYDSAVARMMHLGLAYEAIETPYAWGGGTINGPSVGSHTLAPMDEDAVANEDWTRAGFDCARLMNHLLWVGMGIETSPFTKDLLADITKEGVGEDLGTDLSEARIGDLIFYGDGLHHVGMVAEFAPDDTSKLKIVEAAPVDRGNKVMLNDVPTDDVTHIVRITAAGETSIGR